MNREEAKHHLEWIPHFDEDKFIDEIYNDFESRTCENCKYLDDRGDEIFGCFKLMIKVDKLFGCSKFERKQYE